jgi:hypothetical protein
VAAARIAARGRDVRERDKGEKERVGPGILKLHTSV